MDVQSENTEPPPSESQPSGKIRKGFKLFGKRKPGNIFSIRSKSEGNNKSPLHRSKTVDVPDSGGNDSEQDQEKEKIQEEEQADDEQLGEDGVYMAAAPPRTSISSASSAKSLGFLSILRGSRRGVGDRRVHTVSQVAGRQRRGIKGLFGNVKFRSKDKDEKDEKEDAPPSPLLMSSRSNSVEIIKEDLTLTPKSHPRSLDSPGTESSEPTFKSLTGPDSSTTSPTKTVTPGGKANESQASPQAAMVPGETSLSTLLADISSLLTFDSISGGDIMADVEAEWGKSSGALTPVITDTSPLNTLSKPLPSFSTSLSPKSSTSILTSQPSSNAPSSPLRPSSIITTLTKSTTLTTPTIKSTTEMATNGTTKPSSSSTIPFTNTYAPIMSSPQITMKTSLPVNSATTVPPNTPATETKASSTAPKLPFEHTETPKTSSVSSFATTAPAAIAKTTPVMPSPPFTSTFTQSSTPKPDLTSSVPPTSFNKVPVTVSVTSSVTAQASPPAPLISSKMTTTEAISLTVSVSTAQAATPAPTLCTAGMSKTPIVRESSNSDAVHCSKTLASSESETASKPVASVYLNGTLSTPVTISLPSKPSFPPASSQNLQASSLSVSKETPLSISQPKLSATPSEMPSFFSKTPIPTSQISASSPQIPLASTTAPLHPALSQTSSCPVSSAPLTRDGSGKKRGSDPCSVDMNLTSPKSPEPRDAPRQDSHQIKDDKKRTSQGHSTGLSKIPIVGGGRVGKIPVRVVQQTEEEAIKDTVITPPEETTPHFNSHDSGSKDKIANLEVAVVASKQSQEELQTQPKAPTCSPRDSKIPVKHGSQIPQAKTKIPVSKVPVRRAGAKPTTQSSGMQIRK